MNILKCIIATTLVCALVGCVSMHATYSVDPLPPNEAALLVYPSGVVALTKLDGKPFIAKTATPVQHHVLSITPGEHILSIRRGLLYSTPPIRLKAEAGHVYSMVKLIGAVPGVRKGKVVASSKDKGASIWTYEVWDISETPKGERYRSKYLKAISEGKIKQVKYPE